MVENNNEPLVSIVVVTYNSSKFVLETLESAKNQTYKNVELIITDDCSTDNTVIICKSWVNENRYCFVDCKVLESTQNTGIASNNNRGLNAAKGEWIKFIAGDDILLENCIEDFIEFAKNTPGCKIIFGKSMKLFQDSHSLIESSTKILKHFKVSPQEQKNFIYYQACPSPESFIRKSAIEKVGGYDENYKFIEDHPLWLKLVDEGVYFYFINKNVVIYRIHNDSITSSGSESFIRLHLFKDRERLFKDRIIPYLLQNQKWFLLFNIYNEIYVKKIIILLGNKNNKISKMMMLLLLHSTFSRIVNKFYVFINTISRRL